MAERSPQDRSRRRFARRQWARRWLAWRPVLLLVLLLGVIGFGAYAIYFSPWLRVEGAEVTGTSQLTQTEVVAAAELPTGDALARVDLAAVEARIEGRLTAVKAVEVSRQWPHDLRIEVEEWEPLAVVTDDATYEFLAENGDTFTYVELTPGGRLVPEVPQDPPADLPRVVLGSEADLRALEEAAAVVAALDPAVTRLVAHLEVETADRIVLALGGGKTVEWGSAEQSDEKAEVLLTLLDARPKAEQYDVSVPGLPATR